MTSSPSEPPPFLEDEPPPWAARGLSVLLLVIFAVGIVALFVVQVPETVSATFVLEPMRDADPVRALHPGIVSAVNVTEAQIVRDREVLFVLASEQVGDRVSERGMISARLAGQADRRTNERLKYDNQERADHQEQQRFEQRLSTLQRQAELKEQRLSVTQDIASRRTREFNEGLSTVMDLNKAKLDVDGLAGELEQARADIADTRNALARLTFEIASRRAAFAESQRVVAEELTTYRARKSVLDQDASRDGNTMTIAAPCAGTVVRLHVQQQGTVVHEGDVLAELVCAHEPLQAVLRLPERGLALARVGQSVKLLYDAFPYERYGVQYGVLKWLSPGSPAGSTGSGFRAFAELGAHTVGVQGQPRAVLPGMTGRASVIIGRRSLASYALEPLRQMRESLATGPSGDSPAPRAGTP
jgi:membrane fusion protein